MLGTRSPFSQLTPWAQLVFVATCLYCPSLFLLFWSTSAGHSPWLVQEPTPQGLGHSQSCQLWVIFSFTWVTGHGNGQRPWGIVGRVDVLLLSSVVQLTSHKRDRWSDSIQARPRVWMKPLFTSWTVQATDTKWCWLLSMSSSQVEHAWRRMRYFGLEEESFHWQGIPDHRFPPLDGFVSCRKCFKWKKTEV